MSLLILHCYNYCHWASLLVTNAFYSPSISLDHVLMECRSKLGLSGWPTSSSMLSILSAMAAIRRVFSVKEAMSNTLVFEYLHVSYAHEYLGELKCRIHSSPSIVSLCKIQTAIEDSDTDMVVVIPLSALDAGIFYWILAALHQTIKILEIRSVYHYYDYYYYGHCDYYYCGDCDYYDCGHDDDYYCGDFDYYYDDYYNDHY